MTKEELLRKLRASELNADYYFIELGSEEDDVTISMVSANTCKVVMVFSYDTEAELAYDTHFVTSSFYEMKDICDILAPIFNPDLFGEEEE